MMDDVDVYPGESLEALTSRVIAGCSIPLDEAGRRRLTEHVHVWLTKADLERRPHMLFDGCKAISGIAEPYETNVPHSSGTRIIYKTEFHPKPQWERYPGKAVPLGFFEGFDLYFAEVTPNEKTVVVRRGDGPTDYAMPNPVLAKIATAYADDLPVMRALEEAHRRAELLHIVR